MLDAPVRANDLASRSRLGELDDLHEVIDWLRVDRVIVAFTPAADSQLVQLLRSYASRPIRVEVVPRLFDLVRGQAQSLGDLPLLEASPSRPCLAERACKRALDAAGAFLLLVVLAPVFALVALAVWLDDRGPVLFRQTRIGRAGRPFEIVKFRTMVRDADELGLERVDGLTIDDAVKELKQEDDPRTTRVGSFLRRASLDELPQLVNVLRGEMSLVGPRPLRPFEVEALTAWQSERQDVLPGITGLWQVLGRSDISWPERMQLDYRYVRHWSVAEDLRILASTPAAVFQKRGAV
jgi:exopolysaccharide biosynthesis polyprenyl glycosylphosphotransferase